MKQITINNFGGGMANDKYAGGSGEFSTSRQFDILTYPNRLFPTISMEAGTASTGIGNMITASDGIVYGVGTQSDNQNNGGLWYVDGSGVWQFLTASGGVAGPKYNFLIEYKRYGAKSILFMDNTIMVAVDKANNLSTTAATFTPTAIGQGFVHPKDNILYVPYQISGTTVLGTMTATSWAPAIFTLPAQFAPALLTNYGDYLAMGCSVSNPTYFSSTVYLWDRDTSNTLPNESITWGDGYLQVLNNLNGALVGVLSYSSNDSTSILIKGWSGGEVQTIKEIIIPKLTTTSPTVTINPRVNFIHRNRLYFSVDIAGGGTSPSHKGLWSVGKNKNGQWSVTVERFASTDGTDVSVLAATFKLDYLYACHTAEGTLTDNGNISSTLTTAYASTSYWESVVNPNMPDTDKVKKKKLMSVAVHTLPLTTSGQVIVKYRVDSNGDWITVFTKTSTSPDTDLVFYESNKPASGQFTDGYNYEFRVESTGGAQIVGITYKYNEI